MTLQDAVLKYGAIQNGIWPQESDWCVFAMSPPELTWINSATGKKVSHIYCNRDIKDPLEKALQNVVQRGLNDELKTFDGCFQIRCVRGCPNDLSTHAYALGIDVNAAENVLGSQGNMSPELVACFTDEGFNWGGNFQTRKDPMHFSRGWE